MTYNEFNNNQEFKRQELLYYELPSLIHKILLLNTMPNTKSEELLRKDIEEIKKITNTECKSVLSYFN